jgi:hypothetical protein
MQEKSCYLSEDQQKQYKQLCDQLGLNNRNIAHILTISNWYVGDILAKQKMSSRMYELFSVLILFLKKTASSLEGSQLTFKCLPHETVDMYRKRKKQQLKELKAAFRSYSAANL